MKPNIDPIIIRRGLHVSLLVGSIMILINQGPAMAVGELPAYWQVALTYAVPFLVKNIFW